MASMPSSMTVSQKRLPSTTCKYAENHKFNTTRWHNRNKTNLEQRIAGLAKQKEEKTELRITGLAKSIRDQSFKSIHSFRNINGIFSKCFKKNEDDFAFGEARYITFKDDYHTAT